MMIDNDLLSQTLDLMRVTGSVLLVESYSPPWAVHIPEQDALLRLLMPVHDANIATFHFVLRGGFVLDGADQTRLHATSGDVVIVFGGLAHTISQGNPVVTMHLENHLHNQDRLAHSFGVGEAPTALICGVFLMKDTQYNPLFAALPPFLHLEQRELASAGLSLTVPNLLAQEIMRRKNGSDYAIQRLLELMCVDILRTYALVADDSMSGWLRGINDPVLMQDLNHFRDSLSLLVSMNGIENASVKNEQSIRNTQCGLTFTLCEPAPSNQRSTRCHSNVMFEGERENSRTDVERN